MKGRLLLYNEKLRGHTLCAAAMAEEPVFAGPVTEGVMSMDGSVSVRWVRMLHHHHQLLQ